MSVIAIVGGGASGTLTAAHLLRGRGDPPRVVLIDRDGRHGLGQAYSTPDPDHLLNACASRMSALADDPGHLLRWLRGQGLDLAGTDFLPRGLYGRYLRATLAEAGPLTRVTRAVTGLDRPESGRPVRLRLADGGVLDADAVVLATGNRASAGIAADGARYVPDPWAPGALDAIGDGRSVLVAGTGLTMVDVATTVTRAHPDTVVLAVSRHGLLPRPHLDPSPPPADVALPAGPLPLGLLMEAVRCAVRDNGGEWRGVVDGLRPRVPELWERLSADDRRRFLARAARYWEVHRHRIPPATAARIERLRATGRLRVLRGRVVSSVDGPDGVTVTVAGDDGPYEVRAGWLVNGTGPSGGPAADPLLGGLIAAGAARADPLGLGLDADASGAVLDASGRPHDRIFTLGPPLRGLRYETTAVPEIRAQAAALAALLRRTPPAPRREPGAGQRVADVISASSAAASQSRSGS